MIFQELLAYCKVKAIGDALSPTEDSVYREYCRFYSETFHTPLHQVFELDPEVVVLSVCEKMLEDIDPDKDIDLLMEQLLRIENPDFEKDEEDELQELIEQLKAENERNQKKDEEITSGGEPKSGTVDFSHLKEEG